MPNDTPQGISSQTQSSSSSASSNLYAKFDSSSENFYSRYKQSATQFVAGSTSASGLAASEKSDTDTTRGSFGETLKQILDEDKATAIKLEDSPEYKFALLPDSANPQNIDSASVTNIDAVCKKFQTNYQAAQAKLEAHLIAEEEYFNKQLSTYTRNAKLKDPNLKSDEFEKNQRAAFKEYQQTQLNNLKEVYEKREQTFLQRLQDAQHDLQRFRGIGLTGQALRDEFTRPSQNGDGLNKRLEELKTRNYEYFVTPVENLFADPAALPVEAERLELARLQKLMLEPDISVFKFAARSMALNSAAADFKKKHGYDPLSHGASLANKLCYSIDLQEKDGKTSAHVRFDTPNKQIAYQDRLSGWCTASDKLITKGKNHFDLTWAKLSFPTATQEQIKKGIKKNKDGTFEQVPGLTVKRDMFGEPMKVSGKFVSSDQRYESVLDMTRHILGQNPRATVEPGYLPLAYQKRFNEMMKTENADKIYFNARQKAGLTTNVSDKQKSEFAVNDLSKSKTDLSSVSSNNVIDKGKSSTASFKPLSKSGTDLHKSSTDKPIKENTENSSSISFGKAIK
ncbi:MAG: hypothetical protein HKM04_12005 [Legionellales bacterium]|nr:hypothetical protein [Legionellales bacterium]